MTTRTIDQRPDRITLGVTLMLGSTLMMSIQEAIFKLFSTSFTLWQIFTLRGLFAVSLLLLISRFQGLQGKLWREVFSKGALLRSLYMTLMFITMYGALPFLDLATAAAAIYTAPVFVTLMSAYAIGEPVKTRGWLAIALGFIGVLVILQPGTDIFSFWALLPLFGGFLYALSSVTTRSLCQGISLPALALSLNLALLATGIVLSFIMSIWHPPDNLVESSPFLFNRWAATEISGWLIIILLAAFTVVVGMSLAGAYQVAPPATIATFDYSYLIFMVLWDFVFFSTSPGFATITGILMIISAGLLVMRRR